MLRSGLAARAGCSAACSLRARLIVSRATARRLHLRSRVIGSVTLRLGAAGRRKTVIRIGRAARVPLRRAGRVRATLELKGSDGFGSRPRLTRAIVLS